MTLEYSNNKFDLYTISVERSDISFSTIYWVVKNQFHNDGEIIRKYTNLMINEVKRK